MAMLSDYAFLEIVFEIFLHDDVKAGSEEEILETEYEDYVYIWSRKYFQIWGLLIFNKSLRWTSSLAAVQLLTITPYFNESQKPLLLQRKKMTLLPLLLKKQVPIANSFFHLSSVYMWSISGLIWEQYILLYFKLYIPSIHPVLTVWSTLCSD